MCFASLQLYNRFLSVNQFVRLEASVIKAKQLEIHIYDKNVQIETTAAIVIHIKTSEFSVAIKYIVFGRLLITLKLVRGTRTCYLNTGPTIKLCIYYRFRIESRSA